MLACNCMFARKKARTVLASAQALISLSFSEAELQSAAHWQMEISTLKTASQVFFPSKACSFDAANAAKTDVTLVDG